MHIQAQAHTHVHVRVCKHGCRYLARREAELGTAQIRQGWCKRASREVLRGHSKQAACLNRISICAHEVADMRNHVRHAFGSSVRRQLANHEQTWQGRSKVSAEDACGHKPGAT